nr:hypothetical protein GCM10020092_071290 [Actinoplanes digitatis]
MVTPSACIRSTRCRYPPSTPVGLETTPIRSPRTASQLGRGEPVQAGPHGDPGEQAGLRGGRSAEGQPGGGTGRARGQQATTVHGTLQLSPCPYG